MGQLFGSLSVFWVVTAARTAVNGDSLHNISSGDRYEV